MVKMKFSKKKIIFIILFGIMVFVGRRINFSAIIGAENQYFTLFQFFGPVAGSFLGPILGAISVLMAEIADYLIFNKVFTLINIIRLTPMLFAAYYFGNKKRDISLIIPVIAMALFIAHPVGRKVWFFSLYWTIPIIVKLLPKRYSTNVLLKSLGATFTAHSVGSTAWLYTVAMTPEQWIALIPIVAYERFLFASGIAGSYIVINTVLDKLSTSLKISDVVNIDKSYVLLRKFRVRV